MLGFIWFYSSESGLFNGLRRIQIKNFLSRLSSRPGLWAKRLKPHFLWLRAPAPGRSFLAALLTAEHHSADFCLAREMVGRFWNYLAPSGDSDRLTELRP